MRISTVRVTIDSPSHYILADGLRESSESKPANEIYRDESEVYYQAFKTMFQMTIGGHKRLSLLFCSGQKCVRSWQKKKDKVGMFSV